MNKEERIDIIINILAKEMKGYYGKDSNGNTLDYESLTNNLHNALFPCEHESISALYVDFGTHLMGGTCDKCGERVEVPPRKALCEHITVSEMTCSKCGKRVPVKYDGVDKLDMPEELKVYIEPTAKTAIVNRKAINKLIRIIRKNVEDGRSEL